MPEERIELSPRVRFRSVGDQGVLVHVERGEVAVLNGPALRALELIRETGSRPAVIDGLAAEYEVSRDRLAADLDTFVAALKEQQMLKPENTE